VALEPELAASLAGRLSEDVLTRLEDVTSGYATPASSPEEEREQHVASLRFHAILAEQSENALLGFVIDFMVNLLSDLTVYRRLYAPPNLKLREEGHRHHEELIGHLRAGRAEEARAIMREHMEIAARHMQGQEAEMLRRFIPEWSSLSDS